MKKLKSLVFFMLFTFLMSGLFICSASEEHNIDWESLSQRTQLPVETLKDGYNLMSYEEFMESVEGIENSISSDTVSTNDEYEIMPLKMTQYNWNRALKASSTGSIWVTKDYTTYMYNHGHCAIVSGLGYNSGNLYILTVEHLGDKAGYKYSQVYNSLYSNHWKDRNTMRVYDVKSNTNSSTPDKSKMNAAGKYASENLKGKRYNPVAHKNDTYVNCATLVYKAYRSQGIYLENPVSTTVVPKDIVKDTNVMMKVSIEWPGGEHTW